MSGTLTKIIIKRKKEIYGNSGNHGPGDLYYFNIDGCYFESMIKQDFDEFKKLRETSDSKSLKLPYSLIDILLNFYDASFVIDDKDLYSKSYKEKMYKIAEFVLKHNLVTNPEIASTQYEIDKIIEFVTSSRYLETESWNQPYIDLPKAAEINAFNVVKYFVEMGVDPNTNVGVGYAYALDFAISNNNFEMVKYLVEHGADINCINNYTYHRPKYDSENFDKNVTTFEILKFLLKQNIDKPFDIESIVKEDYNNFIDCFISKAKKYSEISEICSK